MDNFEGLKKVTNFALSIWKIIEMTTFLKGMTRFGELYLHNIFKLFFI